MKYSIVFGYRNRDMERVQRCLDSLAEQSFKDFDVVFTDYGSDAFFAKEIKALCSKYPFVNFVRNETNGHPWNRAHALNTGLRLAKGDYVVFGDVDMIYSKNFLASLNGQEGEDVNLYGECVMLSQHFSDWSSLHNSDGSEFKSFGKAGKGGVHIVSRAKLESIGGYDEFYCYWGVEDRDLNLRLTAIGLREKWIENQAPVFHQWHPVTSDFSNSGFPLQWWEEMNLYFERNKQVIERNAGNWGHVFTAGERTAATGAVKTVPLETIDAIFGEKSKTGTIKTIYEQLDKLSADERVEFTYTGRAFPSAPAGKQSFGRFVQNEAEYNQYVKQIAPFTIRINHFIPEEDLPYIFWNIVRNDTRFDYSFHKTKERFSWTFARKR